MTLVAVLDYGIGNLRSAQDAYTVKLFGYLPEGRLRILDIGGGAGETAKKLLDEKLPSNTLMKRWSESAGK